MRTQYTSWQGDVVLGKGEWEEENELPLPLVAQARLKWQHPPYKPGGGERRVG